MSIISGGKIGSLKEGIFQFWKENDQKILTIFAIFLTAIVSFQAGVTHQKSLDIAKINVSLVQDSALNSEQEKALALGEAVQRKAGSNSDIARNLENTVAGANQVKEDSSQCAFVGSKNSNKYHLPNCRYAANIKPENKVCFSSKEDAEAKGYVPAGCCIK